MISGSLARRYARALLGLAREDKAVDKVDAELQAFLEVLDGSPELAAAIADPTLLPSSKRSIVDAIVAKLGFSPHVKNFFSLLAEKGRLSAFREIRREFRRMADELEGRVRAVVTSAAPLPKETEGALAERLSRISGRTVEISHQVDPELLGGLMAEIDGVVYDGSLKSQLRRLKDAARST